MIPSPISTVFLFLFAFMIISTIHRVANRSIKTHLITHPVVSEPVVTNPDIMYQEHMPVLTKKEILHSAFGINSIVSPPFPIKPFALSKNKNDTYESLKRSMLLP
jgi:hypothetical protein